MGMYPVFNSCSGLKYPALIEKRPMINTLGDKGVFALSGYAKRETDGRFLRREEAWTRQN